MSLAALGVSLVALNDAFRGTSLSAESLQVQQDEAAAAAAADAGQVAVTYAGDGTRVLISNRSRRPLRNLRLTVVERDPFDRKGAYEAPVRPLGGCEDMLVGLQENVARVKLVIAEVTWVDRSQERWYAKTFDEPVESGDPEGDTFDDNNPVAVSRNPQQQRPLLHDVAPAMEVYSARAVTGGQCQ